MVVEWLQGESEAVCRSKEFVVEVGVEESGYGSFARLSIESAHLPDWPLNW